MAVHSLNNIVYSESNTGGKNFSCGVCLNASVNGSIRFLTCTPVSSKPSESLHVAYMDWDVPSIIYHSFVSHF